MFALQVIFFSLHALSNLASLQLPQNNPGFNNPPFKFTKYSNAYMLVYIRESDKDKIICNVDEKDVAEHLRVRNSVTRFFLCLSVLFCLNELSLTCSDR